MILTVCGLCVLNVRSVLVAYEFVSTGMQRGDPEIWADGGGTPLGAQLSIAAEVQAKFADDTIEETIILVHPVLELEHEMNASAFPFHLRQTAHRLLDVSGPHIVFPAEETALLLDENNSRLPEAYADRVERIATLAPYSLYLLPAESFPRPRIFLGERPGYANGLRLLGYEELGCDGHWRLHWTPGPASMEGGYPAHFFVHLLDDEGQGLAQLDVRTYDVRSWRPGDHIVTEFDFGQELTDLPITTIRVGLYLYSDETQSIHENIYALDEQGRPWEYAVDIPFVGVCVV